MFEGQRGEDAGSHSRQPRDRESCGERAVGWARPGIAARSRDGSGDGDGDGDGDARE